MYRTFVRVKMADQDVRYIVDETFERYRANLTKSGNDLEDIFGYLRKHFSDPSINANIKSLICKCLGEEDTESDIDLVKRFRTDLGEILSEEHQIDRTKIDSYYHHISCSYIEA